MLAKHISRPFVKQYLKLSNRTFRSSACLGDSALPQHRESAHNPSDGVFEFKDKAKVDEILSRYPTNYKQSAVMPLLWLAQKQNNNWVPVAAMNKIAEIVDVAPIRVYETATFFTMYNREPLGKYHIQLCGTTPCQLCGAESILQAVTEEAGIVSGETSKDGLFTLTEVECLGACVNAPMVQINDDYYEDLTPESMKKMMRDLKEGKGIKIGPQNGRNMSEGVQGRTSLKKIPKVECRDFEKVRQEYEAKQKKK